MAADLSTDLDALAEVVGDDVKIITAKIGVLASLTTTQKSSLVAAVNEVAASIGSAAGIDDGATSTTSTWSSSKTNTEIADARASLKAEILGGAGPAYDTLEELRALLTASDSDDDAAIAALTTALGNRVRFDEAQTLTSPQQAQARTNIGAASAADVGNVAALDSVATYNAAKA
jgi:hypothetical protein